MRRPDRTTACVLIAAAVLAGCGDDDGDGSDVAVTTATTTAPLPQPAPSGLVSQVVDGDLDTPIAGATVAAFDENQQLGPGAVTGPDGRWILPVGATIAYARVDGRAPNYARIDAERTADVVVRLYNPGLQSPEAGGGPQRTRTVPLVSFAVPTGPPAWTPYRSAAQLGRPPAVSNGLAVLVDTKGQMVAIGSRGKVRWRAQVDSGSGLALTTPTILQETQRVLVASRNGRLLSFDLAKGRRLAEEFGAGRNPLTTPPLVTGRSVFVGTSSGRVYKLNADGLQLECSYAAGATIVGTPARTQQHVVVADESGTVTALDPETCRPAWKTPTGGRIADGPAVADERVVVGTAAKELLALDERSGTVAWRYRTDDVVTAAPAIASGTVYVGDFAGHLHAVAMRDGSRRWRRAFEAPIRGGATIVGTNVWFATGTAGTMTTIAARTSDGRPLWQLADGTATPAVAAGRTLFLVGHTTLRAYRAP